MPSPLLVREAVALSGRSLEVVRSAVAVAQALAAVVRTASAVGRDDRALIAELANLTGLPGAEAEVGLDALREAGAVVAGDAGVRLDPDLFCTLPALASVDGDRCRDAIAAAGGRLAPALAVLHTIARASRMGRDGGGDWVHVSVRELAAETLYGRTAVTQALRELAAAGLVIRAEQASRLGLRLRLHPRALGEGSAEVNAGARDRPGANGPAGNRAASEGQGMTVEIGGASIGVPAGSRLQLPSGIDYRLEIGPGGGAIIRIDD